MAPIIEARGLRKRYGDVDALDGLELVAESGQVTAVLGPNGAGKSTFVGAVATLVHLDEGDLHVGGLDVVTQPQRVRQIIALAGQAASVEPAMTGRENVEWVARLCGMSRRAARAAAGEVLERLSLTEAGDRLVRTYSGGMRRRLDLGASLVGRPRLLLLDEPTTGLDPRSRAELWDAIGALVDDGTDVLLTTQYLEEADRLAQRIVIVDHGRVIAAGTPDELKSLAGRDVIEIRPRDRGDVATVEALLAVVTVDPPRADPDSRLVTVAVDRGTTRMTDLLRALDEHMVAVDDIGLRRPSLDDVFLTLTGRQATPVDSPSDNQLEAQTPT